MLTIYLGPAFHSKIINNAAKITLANVFHLCFVYLFNKFSKVVEKVEALYLLDFVHLEQCHKTLYYIVKHCLTLK